MRTAALMLIGSLLLGTPNQGTQEISTYSSSSYRKTIVIDFTTSGTYTWKQSGAVPSIMSVEMVYKSGVGTANTFDLDYVRAGVTRDLVEYTHAEMRTFTWYVPSDKYPEQGDVWTWSNTAGGKAILTVDVAYQ
jgi:hypothetical protein